MLDLHVLYLSGGNVNLTSVNTIPAGDGQVVAGVPLLTSPRVATLAAWGGWVSRRPMRSKKPN